MNRIYLTSDLHLGCENLVANTRREFVTCEQHDAHLIHNINETVARKDTLYILGDFCTHKSKVAAYRQRINCKHIFFIMGNHDHLGTMQKVFGSGNVCQQKMVKLTSGLRAFCGHYPKVYWDRSHYGVCSLYGHIHNKAEYEETMDRHMPGRRSLDVGMDSARQLLGDYLPFSSEYVETYMSTRRGHEEIWRDIIGYEGMYQVSTYGNVRSLDRYVYNPAKNTDQLRKGRPMSLASDQDNYKVLSLSKDGQKRTRKVHQLVLESFVGPLPEGQQVLHGVNGSDCNWLINLKYGTAEENWDDRRRDGTCLRRRVRRSDGKEYVSQTEASRDTGCLSGGISNVCYGRAKTAGGFGWEFID